eukprot:scaffold1436_cov250-Pinguiococcus_pyrenoidosus.AAC.2
MQAVVRGSCCASVHQHEPLAPRRESNSSTPRSSAPTARELACEATQQGSVSRLSWGSFHADGDTLDADGHNDHPGTGRRDVPIVLSPAVVPALGLLEELDVVLRPLETGI